MNPNSDTEQLNKAAAAAKLATELKWTQEQLHLKQRQFDECRKAKKATEKQLKTNIEDLEREKDINRNIYTLNTQLSHTAEQLQSASASTSDPDLHHLSNECAELSARCAALQSDIRRLEQERDDHAQLLPTVVQRVKEELDASRNVMTERLQIALAAVMQQAQGALDVQSDRLVAKIMQELREGRITATPSATPTTVALVRPTRDQDPSN